MGFWTWVWSMRHCRLGQEVACWSKCWEKSTVSFDLSNTGSIGLWLRKNHLLRCWGWPSLLSWNWALTWSVAKTASKKIGALIRFMKFLSPGVALYLYKSTIGPYMEYCCHVWAGAPSCYLQLLDKLQKRICRTVGPSLDASLEPLTRCHNVASLSLFYRYYFGRTSELAQLVPLPFSCGSLLIILIDCMIFLSLFLDVTRMSMLTVSSSRSYNLEFSAYRILFADLRCKWL